MILLKFGFVITGTLHIRYYSTMGVLDAELKQAGGRLASTIIESWQNSKKTNFDLAAELLRPGPICTTELRLISKPLPSKAM